MATNNKKKKRPEIKAGEKFYWWDKELWHIVGTLPDGGSELVVVKSWAKYKNRWIYKVEHKELLEWYFDNSKTYAEITA